MNLFQIILCSYLGVNLAIAITVIIAFVKDHFRAKWYSWVGFFMLIMVAGIPLVFWAMFNKIKK